MFVHFLSGRDAAYAPDTQQVRKAFSNSRLKQVHIVSTLGILQCLKKTEDEVSATYPEVSIHRVELSIEDIRTTHGERLARDRIYKLLEEIGGHYLVIGSGGRQVLTFRLLEAGHIFGFRGYLSITAYNEVRWNDFSQQEILYMPIAHFLEQRWNQQKGLYIDSKGMKQGSSFRSVSVFPACRYSEKACI
ncbi:MAG TPA: hypothetical protein EYP57_04995 [Thermodesulfobacteriaceae bacterium]|nr:hypothetical protein [Thermodesulfobacteriaceae bacterium]